VQAKDLIAIMHQRVGFYVSKSGKLITMGNYGVALDKKDDPNDGNGIGRVVREIKKDGSYGPIYFIYYNHGFNEKNTDYPYFKKSKDREFVKACQEILDNPLYMMQWVEEADTLVVLNLLKDKLTKEEATEVDENYEFTTLASDPSNVVANIAVMTASDAIRPEIVDKIQSYKETNANHDTILVVSVPTNSGSEGTKVYQKLINLNPRANVLGNDAPQLEKAFESLYERNGIKVFYGAEGLIEAISYIGRNL
jgi:hypothetical protein